VHPENNITFFVTNFNQSSSKRVQFHFPVDKTFLLSADLWIFSPQADTVSTRPWTHQNASDNMPVYHSVVTSTKLYCLV